MGKHREEAERAWSRAMGEWQNREGYIRIIEESLDAVERCTLHQAQMQNAKRAIRKAEGKS